MCVFLCIRLRSRSRVGEDGLGRGRQSVAHGVDADARAVDGSEVSLLLGGK